MVIDNSFYMKKEGKNLSKYLSFDGKNLLAGFGLLAIMLMVGGVMAQAQSVPDVAVNSNGVTINTGSLDVQGNDIEDAGTTLYDASTGEFPDSVLGINLSSNAGNDLTWDSNNNEFDVDSSTIQSGTASADVGLGNVENIALSSATWTDIGISQSDVSSTDVGLGTVLNKEQLAVDGSNSMNADLDMSSNNINDVFSISGADTIESSSDGNMVVKADGTLTLAADDDGSFYGCSIQETDGAWTCDGTKSWRHELNQTHNAIYTSQESPRVRAVYEGKAEVDGETKIDLPEHWTKTVSDTEPILRSTATVQGKLAYAAVIEKTDDYIVIDSNKPATVNYRITGIRDGWENQKVVREK